MRSYKTLIAGSLAVAAAFGIAIPLGYVIHDLYPTISDDVLGTVAAVSLAAIAFGVMRLIMGPRFGQSSNDPNRIPNAFSPERRRPDPDDPEVESLIERAADFEKRMGNATLAEIQAEIDRRAALLGASGDMLPTYGVSRDFGYPHIEAGTAGYHYVVVERGRELKRITTPHLYELLYRVFEPMAFSLAGGYEVEHRIAGEDCRRQIFRYQVELLSRLDPGWAERCRAKHLQILKENPFEDR